MFALDRAQRRPTWSRSAAPSRARRSAIELAAAQVTSSTPAQIRAALERRRASAAPRCTTRSCRATRCSRPISSACCASSRSCRPGLTFEQVKRKLAHLSDDPMYAVLRLVQTHLATWSSDTPRRLRMLDTVRELARELSREPARSRTLWRFACEHAHAIATSSAAQHDRSVARARRRRVRQPARRARPPAAGRAGRRDGARRPAGLLLVSARRLPRRHAVARGRDREELGHEGEALARALLGAGRLALLDVPLRARRAAARARARRSRSRSTICTVKRTPTSCSAASRASAATTRVRTSCTRAASRSGQRSATHARRRARATTSRSPRGSATPPACRATSCSRGGMRRRGTSCARSAIRRSPCGALLNRGAILHHRGDPAAREVLGRAFAEAIAARFHEGIAWSLDLIGKVSLERGEFLQARAQLAAALRVHRRLGDRWRCASVLEALAAVAVASDRPARGAVYLGAAEAMREQIGTPVPACEQADARAAPRRAASS